MNDATEKLTAVGRHRRLDAVWQNPSGWGRLGAVNHTVVGRRFIVTAFVYFLIGGMLAMLLRTQLATPNNPFLGPDAYNRIFTMHGTVMMFLFVIPMIEGLALYMLPKILGARDLAFPRLSAFGYWCYFFGGLILLTALVMNVAPDSGWFMYPPLSSSLFTPGISADVWLLGVTFVEISAVCAAIEFTVTVLKVRTGGMSLGRMPLLAWYLLVTALMMVGGFPPLILGSILLEIERAFNWPFFDPTRGGDPLLWQHLFWLFGHPEVYIIFLPAAGVVSTLIPVFSRRPIVGYTWIVCAIIALGFLSFGLWVHHMYAVGIPHLALAFFSIASLLVVVPTGVQIFAWLATLLSGRPELTVPMLYVFGFFFVFVAGGLTGVMVAVVPFDWQVHDTHFVVAHLHYVLVGGFVFPMLGAAYYWLPQMTGRAAVFERGRVAFWLIFIGFNLTFFIMHLTGLLGMPRRVYTYEPGLGLEWPNLISSIGAFLMTMGFGLFIVDMVLQLRYGLTARRNLWGAGTLEWAMRLPPASYNFLSLPRVSGRDPLHDDPNLPAALAAGHGYLDRPLFGRMETLGVEMARGRPDQIILLPGPTMLPLFTALGLAFFFVSFLFSAYLISLAGLGAALVCVLAWLWRTGLTFDPEPQPIGLGEIAPAHVTSTSSPGWWGMLFTLLADTVFFGSLVFGYLFLWTSAPLWPPLETVETDWLAGGVAAGGLLLAALATTLADWRNRAGSILAAELWLVAAALGSVAAVGAMAWIALVLTPDPASHAYAATSAVLAAYTGFHAGIGLIAALFLLARRRAGYISARRMTEPRIAAAWQVYTAVTGLVALGLLYGVPAAMAGGGSG